MSSANPSRRSALRALAILGASGLLAGCFGIGYGLARSFGELFREPDPQLGFLFAHVTMGQLLSIPVIAAGLWLVLRSRKAA